MGLYGALNASVSGMAAQSNKLSAISQNIANSNTTGYKNVDAQFADLISSASQNTFEGSGVTTTYAYANTTQGSYSTTSTATNLAVNGNGFFVVSDSSGALYLTRDGSFTPDADGNLVNASGFTLMGYSLADGAATAVANGSAGLVAVNTKSSALTATPTTTGTISANLPSTATAVLTAANLPSQNSTNQVTTPTSYTAKTSLVTYDNLGAQVTLDVYFTNTTASAANPQWEVTVYDQADAASGGGFPYSNPALTTQTMAFDPTTGMITTPTNLTFLIPNGQSATVDISGMTQLATSFTMTKATVNGNSPSGVSSVSIGADGTLSAVYSSGATVPIFTVPLANVPAAGNLTPISGNVWQINNESGNMVLATAGTGGLGTIRSSTLESSTVDLATELTKMIQAQSGYQANSKVFQTGSDLLSTLINIIK